MTIMNNDSIKATIGDIYNYIFTATPTCVVSV